MILENAIDLDPPYQRGVLFVTGTLMLAFITHVQILSGRSINKSGSSIPFCKIIMSLLYFFVSLLHGAFVSKHSFLLAVKKGKGGRQHRVCIDGKQRLTSIVR